MTLAEARLAGLRAVRLAGFVVALASSLVEAATIQAVRASSTTTAAIA